MDAGEFARWRAEADAGLRSARLQADGGADSAQAITDTEAVLGHVDARRRAV